MKFDQETLSARLARLPPKGRVAFAAAAASRQVSVFEWYSLRFCPQNRALPSGAIDSIWTSVEGSAANPQGLDSLFDRILALLPNVETRWELAHELANEALTCVAYAIRSSIAPDELREPVWAATHAIEAARRAVIRMMGLQPGTPVAESVIASHPVVVRELERQARDLEMLENAGEASRAVDINRVDSQKVNAANAAAARIQEAARQGGRVRENFGPGIMEKTVIPGGTPRAVTNRSLINAHQNHVHLSGQP